MPNRKQRELKTVPQIALYATDEPLDNDSLDRFRRKLFAKRLAETIISRSDPESLVIGLHGTWGSGKTTVLNFVKQNLQTAGKRVVVVEFNPWRFHDEDAIIHAFFEQLASALEKSLKTHGEQLGTLMRRVAPFVPVVGLGLDPNPGKSSGQLSIDIGGTLAKAGEALTTTTVEQEKEQISKLLSQSKRNIVVLLDDIDRLTSSEAQTVFRILKLMADFKYTTYVVAFDQDRVADAIGHYYGKDGKESGYDYLEKVIQVPLALPLIDPLALNAYFVECVRQAVSDSKESMSPGALEEFVQAFTGGLAQRLTTPRVAKRFANIISFGLPLLTGEVNIVDFLLAEGIRVFYPRLHTALHVTFGPEYFATLRDDRTSNALNTIAGELDKYSDTDQKALKGLIRYLFPDKPTSNDTDDKRICSSLYFGRFFSYSVLEGDISDRDIDDLVRSAETSGVTSASARIRELVTGGSSARFLYKMQRRVFGIGPASAGILLSAICDCGEVFSSEDSRVQTVAGELLSGLLDRIPPDTILSIAESVLKSDANPLLGMYAIAVLSRSRVHGQVVLPGLAAAVDRRARQLLAGRPIYVVDSQSTALIFETWKIYQGSVREYTHNALNEYPGDVHELIGSYFGVLPIIYTGNQYADITKFVDANDIVKALEVTLGPDRYGELWADKTSFYERREDVSKEEIARRFIHALGKSGGKSVPGLEAPQKDGPEIRNQIAQ